MPELVKWRSLLLASAGVEARFYGRLGGHSTGPFASLNLGTREGDDPAAIAANETAVLRDLQADGLYLPAQVHGIKADVVVQPYRGVVRGPEADAVWTSIPHLAVGVLTADCVPILIAHESGSFVGAIHAGWKGLLKGVIGRAIERIGRVHKTQPGELLAAIGPAIDVAHYEVDADLARRFRQKPALGGVDWPNPRRKPHLDLRLMALADLRENGVCAGCVELVGPPTSDDRLFSHRLSGGKTGRQLSAVFMP